MFCFGRCDFSADSFMGNSLGTVVVVAVVVVKTVVVTAIPVRSAIAAGLASTATLHCGIHVEFYKMCDILNIDISHTTVG